MRTTLLFVAAVLVAGFAFAEKVTNVIWSEGATFSSFEQVEETPVELDGSLFANVKAGDIIKVTISALPNKADADSRAEAPMRALKNSGQFILANSAENDENGENVIYSTEVTAPGVLDINVDEAIAAKLNASKLYIFGRNITVAKIEVETEEPANPYFAFDGVAYIIDVESGKLVAAGHDWGTRGIVNEMGLDLIFTTNPETNMVTIDSRVSNGGNSHFLGSNLFMDAAPVEWGLLEQEFGFYITDGTKYLSVDANDNLILSDDPHLWIIVTAEGVKAQRLEEMANATAEKPASATFLIKANNFNRNDARNAEAWQVSEDCTNKNLSGGNNVNNCAESYHSVFTISQAIEGAPKGVYALTAQGFYRQDDGEVEDAPLFFANDETAAVPVKSGSENNMSNASDSFTAGLYTIDPIFVEVGEDGAFTVGIKGTAAHQWVIFDNFQLTYFGPNATMDEVKNAAIYAEMNSLRDKANTLKEQVEIEAVKTALENALAETAGATGEEGIKAAIEILKAAVEKAEASLTAKNVLPKMKELVESTNVYTEEALNEYYTQWEVKYLDGSLTKAEAGALQDPTVVTGWHASITCDNFLLSAWDTNPDFNDAPYYINTWSVEGDSDGSNFHVPFFEYWTGDANSLGEKTLTATMNDLPEGDYEVTAWVRVRIKNDVEAPAYGITLSVNEGEAVNVSDGDQVGTSQMFLKDVKATGKVGADGVLKIQFNVAADNNISWLSFKNVKFEKKAVEPEYDSHATYALQPDETHASGEAIEVQNNGKTVATLVFGEEGGEPFKAAKADSHIDGFVAFTEGNGVNGNKEGGTFYTIVPKYDGEIEIGVVLNANKPFYVEEDGVVLADFDGITKEEKYYGTFKFYVTASKSYKFYCSGSKLGFYGFNYNYNAATGINEITNVRFENGVVYNLRGQRVQTPSKGLYIINGKKVMMK
jgi:hypothetical protein